MASFKDADPTLGFLTRKDADVMLPRPTRVKNKTPAPVQITAEQILLEAREGQEPEIRPPKQKITDPTELADYRLQKRKEFEDQIRRMRGNVRDWIKYAQWEESHKDFERARSVWERALEVDHRNPTLWRNYAEAEMKKKFINHARNVWDRAVTLLPRVDQIWYKYIHMEEIIGNVAGARQIYERWMDELDAGPARLALLHQFEMKNGEVARARNVYERAVEIMGDDEEAEQLFVAFAEFEERCKETDGARRIYKFALDHTPKRSVEDLYKKFVGLEKQYGDRQGIEDAIVGKRRFQYEDEVRKNPLNYDSWFDYIRLEESAGNKDRIREVYERAIANVPPVPEKRYWQRYIYLWINYALYEELDAGDMERARDKYIEIELNLGNFDRCRKLYEKYLHWSPENCYAWTKYAELEKSLCETERTRAVFELAIAQPALDMPELLWKAYIDFELSEGEFERARELYERLLDRTKHLKVWIGYAKFEASAVVEAMCSEDQDQDYLREQTKQCVQRVRRIFENAFNYFRTSAPELKEERCLLLEEMLNVEASFGDLGDVSLVQSKLPKKLKKRRPIVTEDGPAGYEEYIDYSFPEEAHTQNLRILEAAYMWKKRKVV
ncbi:hypothetical protein ACE6H2_020136 [Prunus campanulata]